MAAASSIVDRIRNLSRKSPAQINELVLELEAGPLDIPRAVFDDRQGGYGLLSCVASLMKHQPSTHKSATVPRRADDVARDLERVALALWDQGVRPIHQNDQVRLLQYTLSIGADRIFSALWSESSKESRTSIHRMLDHEGYSQYSLVLRLVRMGNVGMCRTLLDLGLVDINSRYGKAKLPLASMVHHRPMLEMLIEKGVDPSLRDALGRQAPAFWSRQVSRTSCMMGLWRVWWKAFASAPGLDAPDRVVAQTLASAIALGRDDLALEMVGRYPPDDDAKILGRSLLQHAIDMMVQPSDLNPAIISGKPMSAALCKVVLNWQEDVPKMSTMLPEGISEGFRFVLSPLRACEYEERDRKWRHLAYANSAEINLCIEDQFQAVYRTSQEWNVPLSSLFVRWVDCVDLTDASNAHEMANLLSRQAEDICGLSTVHAMLSSEALETRVLTQLERGGVQAFLSLDHPEFWMGRLLWRLPTKVSVSTTDPNRHDLPAWRKDGTPHWPGHAILEELITQGFSPNHDALRMDDLIARRGMDEIKTRWPALLPRVELWCLQGTTPARDAASRPGPRL